MASTEMSSSEIRRGSTWETPQPPQPSPPPQEQVTSEEYIVQIDEGIWKRYSSHYEFPLAILLSLGIHIVAFLLVLALMSISYYFGQPLRPPIMEGTVVIGVGPDPKQPAGGGQRQGDNDYKDADFTHIQPDNVLRETPTADATVVPDPFKLEEKRTRIGNPNVKGKDGKGVGDGVGNDIGPGEGGDLMSRSSRWRIQLRYEEPEAFIEQLGNLQVLVAARLNSGRFLIYKDLSGKTFPYEELSEAECIRYLKGNSRLGFMTQDSTSAGNFSYGVGLSERVLALWMYIPKEMEQAILEAELKYHGLTEDQIRARRLETSFQVRREGGRYLVTVVRAQVAKPTTN